MEEQVTADNYIINGHKISELYFILCVFQILMNALPMTMVDALSIVSIRLEDIHVTVKKAS